MVASQDETRSTQGSTQGSDRRKPARDARSGPGGDRPKVARPTHYMVAPAAPGVTGQELTDRLSRFSDTEVLQCYPQRDTTAPPIAVVRMSDASAAALRRSAAGTLVVEPDGHLRAASLAAISPSFPATAIMAALGPGFTATIRIVGDSGTPVEQAEVRLFGEQAAAVGLTGSDGRVELSLHGELPETVTEMFIRPRSGHWGLWQRRPDLAANAVNSFTLKSLSLPDVVDWGGAAMRFDRLPSQCRGAGIKIALIDSGAATSHRQLSGIDHGVDIRGPGGRSWSSDAMGHGTPCAGLIGALQETAHSIRGYAPDSELHVCKLPADARCSDLIAALDYCLLNGVDVACLGFGCERGSALVEQRIAVAKQLGVSLIAAAGNSAGAVLFPACSPHVMAVGAVGQAGSHPEDSPEAALAASATALGGGLFVPLFSSRGPELDLCAPGVAVIACQAADGYAVYDGTSLAAAHVAALAALILAEHGDFKGSFARRDVQRVERLFQILKDTAHRVGHPWLTGAGLPDAALALGVWSEPRPLVMPLNAGLREMRSAIGQMNRVRFDAGEALAFEPLRGPAQVTRLPLNPAHLTSQATGNAKASVEQLKAAMMLAGLAEERR
ncbi:S8 family serine peptidase [Bradyrhizobium sp.]|uniref:S8 family serine peptidase n=1 Tax=Bradyrhizobium sp. TaxID=376 RepID=UPI003C38AFBC